MRVFAAVLAALAFLAGSASADMSPVSIDHEFLLRVRMTDGLVKKVKVTSRTTVAELARRAGIAKDSYFGAATDSDSKLRLSDEATVEQLSLKSGDWIYLLRDPHTSVDTAAAIARMKKQRERMVKGGGVMEMRTMAQLEAELQAAKGLVVIDFAATWCGPCKQIAPKFHEMAEQYTKVTFLKVDVDANKAAAQKYSVTSMPTFVFIKNKKVVDTLKGASEDALREKITSNM